MVSRGPYSGTFCLKHGRTSEQPNLSAGRRRGREHSRCMATPSNCRGMPLTGRTKAVQPVASNARAQGSMAGPILYQEEPVAKIVLGVNRSSDRHVTSLDTR